MYSVGSGVGISVTVEFIKEVLVVAMLGKEAATVCDGVTVTLMVRLLMMVSLIGSEVGQYGRIVISTSCFSLIAGSKYSGNTE